MTNEMTNDTERLGLAAIPLFSQFSPAALEKMSGLMVKVSFHSSETIFLEREPGDAPIRCRLRQSAHLGTRWRCE